MKSSLLVCKLFFCAAVFFGIGFLTADAATLSLSPDSTSTTVNNNTFSVNILLNTQGTSTNGVDIYYLNFPVSLLEVQDDDGGISGIQVAKGALLPATQINSANNLTGRIEFSQLENPGGSGYNGSNGVLATVRFKAIAAGTANVTFDFTPGSTADTNVDGGGVDILTSVTNGSYTITAPADTTPPVRSNGSPSGQLPAGTTQTTLSLITNENATCKYSTTAGISYASMGNTFSTTGGTNHSTNISGLQNGQSYNYYVRCQDFALLANANSDDYPISFSVASGGGGDTTPPVISNIATSSLAQSSVIVSWTTNEAATTQIEYGLTTSLGSQTTLNSTLVTSHSQTISGLTTNTLYYFRVRSADSSGNIATSPIYTFKTLPPSGDSSPPTKPGNFKATTISASKIDLSWTASTDNVAVAGYGVKRCAGTGCSPIIEIATTTAIFYLDTGLTASTTYNYAVYAYDAAGNISPSATSTATTLGLDITPPLRTNTTPSSFPAGTTQINLSLTTDDQATCRYSLVPGETYSAMIYVITNTLTTNHSVNISGLSDGNTYTYYTSCQNADLYFNTDDYIITFLVASGGSSPPPPPPPPPPGGEKEIVIVNPQPSNILKPVQIRNLVMRREDNSLIAEGSTLEDSTIIFEALLFDADNNKVRLEVELRKFDEPFTGEPTLFSEYVDSGKIGSITRGGLINGDYRFNARTARYKPALDVKPAETSDWLSFSDPNIKDFTIIAGSSTTCPAPTETSSGFTYSFNANLAIGLKANKDVEALQKILNLEDVYPENIVSGNFGLLTQKAVIAFQNKYGIAPASGYVGPKTKAKLNELYIAGPSQQTVCPAPITGFQYVFNANLAIGLKANKDVEALQKILNLEDVYPENIVSGNFGLLTQKAVIAFQNKYGIAPASGYVGPKTKAKLNELYGSAMPVILPSTIIPTIEESLTGELVGPFAIGMKSKQVELLQTLLAKDSEVYPDGKITGYYGQLTVEAVKRFQDKYGIEETGIAGTATRVKINEVLGK